jgi:succinate dehydrogenase / fumarate reductase flavoprotein subunit
VRAQGVPFAANAMAARQPVVWRAQVSRTFYARGQTGQLLLGAYQSMMRQVADGHRQNVPQREMLDLVVIGGRAGASSAAIWSRDRSSATWRTRCAWPRAGTHRVFPSTNAVNSNVTAAWRAHKRGALFANPSSRRFTDVHSRVG